MKIFPNALKTDFSDHAVFTVREKGWNGIKNGELLKLMVENDFNALLTFDKNLQHQQNFLKFPITVFVLSAFNNTYVELTSLSPQINQILAVGILDPGPVIISPAAHNIWFAVIRADDQASRHLVPNLASASYDRHLSKFNL